MLAIRMQRTGRKGYAQFRMVVQDSRRTPTSGNIVALVGHYDPHTKTSTIDKEKISEYLSNGAQPSTRVIRILAQEKVKMPDWVQLRPKKTSKVKHADKLRKNRPVEPKAEPEVKASVEPEAVEPVAEEVVVPEEVNKEVTTESTESSESAADQPAAEVVAPVEESIEDENSKSA